MILTLLRVQWTNLLRDRVALALSFLLPIVFFSIFALVFGVQKRPGFTKLNAPIVDEDGSPASARLIEALMQQPGLRVRTTLEPNKPGPPLDRATAQRAVKEGFFPVALVIPQGFGAQFGQAGGGARLELLADESDPIAPHLINGLVQRAAMTGMPDLLVERGIGMFEQFVGELSPLQSGAVEFLLPRLRDMARDGARPVASAAGLGSAPATSAADMALIRIDTLSVMGPPNARQPLISYYAAAIAVMFLLFSASGAAGSLLEEAESGTLSRLLTSQVSMPVLLASKWLFILLVGGLQVSIMFLWGWAVFQLDLWRPSHLAGFAVMTPLTAGAAGALALLLATATRSRAQLGGLSTVVILVMSALGGSMFPRFMMQDWMQAVGRFTFNAWAIDGYEKVFWRGATPLQLWREALVLSLLTMVFLIAARLLARRWERV